MSSTDAPIHPGGLTRDALYDFSAGRLHEETRAWVEEHVKGCTSCAAELERVRAIHLALEPPAEAPFERQRVLSGVRRAVSERPAAGSRRPLALVSFAAMAALVWGVVQVAWPGSPVTCRVVERQGVAALEVGGAPSISAGARLLPGQTLTVAPGGYLIASWGGARFRLEGRATGALLRLDASRERDRRVFLTRGAVALDVDPMRRGRTLSVVTPEETVTVHGTRFSVERDGAGTSVATWRGQVRVRRGAGSVDVSAGQQLGSQKDAPMALPPDLAQELDARMGRTLLLEGGTLDVVSDAAAARVELDGAVRGEAPISLTVSPGAHLVRVLATGLAPFEEQVSVPGDVQVMVHARWPGVSPSDPLAAARAAVVAGKYQEAREQLEALRQKLPDGSLKDQATLLEAQAVRLSGAPEQAVALLKPVSSGNNPESEQALFLLAQTYGRDLKKPDLAAALWAECTRRFPNGIFAEEAAFRVGEAFLKGRREGEGVSALEGYLGRYPRGAHADQAHLLIASVWMGRGSYEEALAQAKAVEGHGPLLQEALVRQARCLAALGRPEEARQAYRQYLKESPSGPYAQEARRQSARLARP